MILGVTEPFSNGSRYNESRKNAAEPVKDVAQPHKHHSCAALMSGFRLQHTFIWLSRLRGASVKLLARFTVKPVGVLGDQPYTNDGDQEADHTNLHDRILVGWHWTRRSYMRTAASGSLSGLISTDLSHGAWHFLDVHVDCVSQSHFLNVSSHFSSA